MAGVACLLSIVSLRHSGAGNAALVTAQGLGILYDRIFLLSQSLMPAVNDILLGLLLYQSRLVPRVLPPIAFIGAPLLVASDLALLFGLLDRISPAAALAALPVALFEFSVGVWLLVKAFQPSPILSSETRDAVNTSLTPRPRRTRPKRTTVRPLSWTRNTRADGHQLRQAAISHQLAVVRAAP